MEKIRSISIGCLLFISSVFSFEAAYLTPSPFSIARHSGDFGNPSSLGFNKQGITTMGLKMRKNDFRGYRFGYQNKGWSFGFLYASPLEQKEYSMSFSSKLFKNGFLGSRFRYTNNQIDDNFVTDLGFQWELSSLLKVGYFAESLFWSEKIPGQSRNQYLGAGIRPFGFMKNFGHWLTVAYQMEKAGYAGDIWENADHKLYGELQLLRWFNFQGSYDLNDKRNWSLGGFLQITPNQMMGYQQTHKNETTDFYTRFHRANKKNYLSVTNDVVVLDLNRRIIEGRVNRSWLSKNKSTGHQNVLEKIQIISNLKGLKLVVIKTGQTSCSMAIAGEIRKALMKLKRRRVRILAFMEYSSRLNYYLASAAHKIVMPPSSYFDVRGYGAEISFYKGLLEKVGVEAQFIRRGKYKSYPEVFTLDEMSQEWKSNITATFHSLWDEFLVDISTSRKIDKDTLVAFFSEPNILLGNAIKHGIVDTMLYEDELVPYALGKKPRRLHPLLKDQRNPQWSEGTEIAVVYMDGTIMSGRSSQGGLVSGKTVGSVSLVKHLKYVRKNPFIRGLILRVESPGGSALASDIIYRELELIRKKGKPIIVSVGSTCASGCYYIVAPANKILAQKNSMIGSIGIFGGKFIVKDLLDTLGVKKEIISTAPYSNSHSMYSKWDSTEVMAIQNYMDEFYDTFTGIVVKHRDISEDSIESVAEGRVFTGSQALEKGLIDQIGGFEDAVFEMKKSLRLSRHTSVKLKYLNGNYEPSLFGGLQEMNAKYWVEEFQNFKRNVQSIKVWALWPGALMWDTSF